MSTALQARLLERTIYGLSFTASLLCASATRRLASATLRAISSVKASDADVGGADTTALDAGMAFWEAIAPFFIAAILAAISARFCAMRASADS